MSQDFADLFREDGRYEGTTHPKDAGYVPDPADRKFAALARAADAILITNDEDLLGNRGRADVCILAPDEAMTTASLTEGREET